MKLKRFLKLLCCLCIFVHGNCFAQWMQLPQDTNNLNSAVCFINPDTGFIAGNYAGSGLLIQRTLNGGATWTTTYLPNAPLSMSICFPDDTTGYSGGNNGLVYKTTNMGTTWFVVGNIGSSTNFSTMYFTSRDTGFIADFSGRILKTTDGGVNWNVVSAVQSSFTNFYPGTGKFQFVTDTIGFIADGNYGRVMKTTDAGDTWSAIDLPTGGSWALSIYMFNKDTGMITSESGKIWRTVNGTTWLGSWIGTAYDLLDITFFNDTVGYIVGGENNNYIFHAPPFPAVGAVIYVSYDAGATWHSDTTLSKDWLTAICDAGNNTAYTVGWKGWVYKLTNANVNVGVQQAGSSFAIEVFPNPAAERIFIRTNLSHFTIEVLDITGRIIFSDADKKELNISPFENGTYILRISSATGTHSEKIIIQH
jgi:hypothetical protein